MESNALQPVSGTRDFYPTEMLERNWLFNQWHNIALKYGFSEYDAPVLEHSSLYTRKGGDDILKEMYSFKDRDGVNLSLRPEMTPSVARMVMSVYKKEVTPIKWYSTPQCWRFESTTRGRKREHYQWNVDIFGADRVKSEVEILTMVINFFTRVGLTSEDVVLKVSNRMILQSVLENMKVDPDKFERVFNIIDKIKKITLEELSCMLSTEIGLGEFAIETLINCTKITNIKDLTFLEPDNPDLMEMIQIFDLMEKSGLSDWIELDLSIVRGLSYYTGMVFEGFFRNITLQRSICGGGRYDNLLEKYGYPERVPAVGFGMGDVVIKEGLVELGKFPKLEASTDYCVVCYSDELYAPALNIASRLRNCDYKVVTYTKTDRKLKNAFSYADRINTKFVILVAPTEYGKNQIVVKNLRSKEEKEKIVDINEYLNSLS